MYTKKTGFVKPLFHCVFQQETAMPATTPQAVDAKLSRAAIFLVVTLDQSTLAETAARNLCAELSGMVQSINFRISEGDLSCILGVGSNAWDRLFGQPRPKELHPFRELHGVHHAPATPGDLLFHIRAARPDLCFELATRIMTQLEGIATVADSVQGFKYFDARDLLGFVDGTENPIAQAARDATLIGDEDAAFRGGSYVIVQKYLHDLGKWNDIPVEQQERIIGRKKSSDIELDDDAKPSYAHNVLTNIKENGEELAILRANMPFGDPGKGEFGTYFIGYARTPSRTERMLENMFIGDPPGNYDRLLDVSRAVTGTLFFVPSASFLDNVDPDAAPDASPPEPTQPERSASAPPASAHGSLRIGSLKKEAPHE